jgi:hypothetical protein
MENIQISKAMYGILKKLSKKSNKKDVVQYLEQQILALSQR